MSVSANTPSLTLPLSGRGDRSRFERPLTKMKADTAEYLGAFPPPNWGRVREGVLRQMPRFYGPDQRAKARQLRQSMTPAETCLWSHLRAHRFLGLSVRRKAPIGPYIVDFLIPKYRLIIEVDAKVPCDARYSYLSDRRYHVLHICAQDIFSNAPAVLQRIADEVPQ